MICNNCGYHFKNSLTCPLCGQSYKKKKVCPVCQKRIHYNQIRCNNCGNPLIKQSTTDVSKYYVNNHNFPKNNKTTVNYNNQKSRGRVIACLEQIGYDNNWLSLDKLNEQAIVMQKNSYGEFLNNLVAKAKDKATIEEEEKNASNSNRTR